MRHRRKNQSSAAGQSQADGAIPASASIPGDSATSAGRGGMSAPAGNNQPSREDLRKAARNTAWGTLLALLLSLGAASMAGGIGTNNDRRDHDSHGIRAQHSRCQPVGITRLAFKVGGEGWSRSPGLSRDPKGSASSIATVGLRINNSPTRNCSRSASLRNAIPPLSSLK